MRKRVSAALFGGLLLAGPALAGELPQYAGKSFRGLVLDAATGQPLEGVAVLVQWVLLNEGPGERQQLLHEAETVTDRRGQYAFLGWGPKPTPSPQHRPERQTPVLVFLKVGYQPEIRMNAPRRAERDPGPLDSEWAGQTIHLTRAQDALEECTRLFLWHEFIAEDAAYPQFAAALERTLDQTCPPAGPVGKLSALPLRGTVTDADTGQPLPGTLVLAQWIFQEPSPVPQKRLHILETVTDGAGGYGLPGWGPTRAWVPMVGTRLGELTLSYFKPGYVPQVVRQPWERTEASQPAEAPEAPVRLRAFRGTEAEWAGALRTLQQALGWGHGMDWRLAPRIALALELERLNMEQTPIAKRGLNISGLYALNTTIEEVRQFLEGKR